MTLTIVDVWLFLAALCFFCGAVRVQWVLEWLHAGLFFVVLWLMLG